MYHSASRFLVAALALLLGACASDPTQRADALAGQAGASHRSVHGVGHVHRVYARGGEGDVVRVYLGGDGQAFLNRRSVAVDPTPADHLTLRLMLADPGPAVFISRPCYYGAFAEPACDPTLWTTERYGPAVLASLARVLDAVRDQHPGQAIHLVGYSGGGVLALLLAAQVEGIAQVSTVATPLDVTAWTAHHGYTPLAGAQNPADLAQWPHGVRQVHLAGARDRNVPPALDGAFFRQMASLGANTERHLLPDFDHTCCWLENWPALLERHDL